LLGKCWVPKEVASALSPRWFSQFSLMQFSNKFKTHFTFNDFTSSSDPLRLLDFVNQLGGYTWTATAISRVT
jgi:hypothetical protein